MEWGGINPSWLLLDKWVRKKPTMKTGYEDLNFGKLWRVAQLGKILEVQWWATLAIALFHPDPKKGVRLVFSLCKQLFCD